MSEEKALPFIPGWLDDLDLTTQEFRILIHFIRRGKCYSSRSEILARCNITTRTFRKAIENLVKLGLVKAEFRVGATTQYTPIFPTEPSANGTSPPVQMGPAPQCKGDLPPVQMGPGGGANGTYKVTPLKVTPLKADKNPLTPQGGKSKPRKPVDVFPKLRFPAELSSKKFQEAFRGWVEFRMEVSPGKSPKDWVRLFQQQLDRHVPEFTESEISEAIRSATTAGWTGFFPKKAVNGYHKNHVPKQSETDQSIF